MGIEPTHQLVAGTLDLKTKSGVIGYPSQRPILQANPYTHKNLANFSMSADVRRCKPDSDPLRHKIDIKGAV